MSYLALPAPDRPTRAVPTGFAYAVVAVVGATVLLVSAYYLWQLALLVHMPVWLAWTLPVALDAGAAGATVCWVGATGAARAWGRGIALSALAGTVAGNALSHLIGFGVVKVGPLLVIVIGAVYPAVLWAMVHLALMLRAEQPEPVIESVIECLTEESVIDHESPAASAATQINAPVVEASGDASRPASSRRRRSKPEQRRAWIAARLDAGHTVTGGEVERYFGTRNGAREVAQVKARQLSAGAVVVA